MRGVPLLIIVVFILFTNSCINDKADDQSGPCDSTYFVSTIKPIFITSCYDPDNNGACHNAAAAIERGNFSVYSAAQNGIQSRLSKIKDRINRPVGDALHMPQGRTLTSDQLSKLNLWLDNGGSECN